VVGFKQHFCIALGSKLVAPGDQISTKLQIIVDFAIEDDRQAQFMIAHGLMPTSFQFQDWQAPEAQANSALRLPLVLRDGGLDFEHGIGSAIGLQGALGALCQQIAFIIGPRWAIRAVISLSRAKSTRF
jgi:hypothetical protein